MSGRSQSAAASDPEAAWDEPQAPSFSSSWPAGATTGTAPARRVDLDLLGTFLLTIDDTPAPVATSCQRLLVFLAFYRRQTRLYAASMLFPDVSEVTALTRLRSVLARLNRTARGVVVTSTRTLSLAPCVHVDVDRLTSIARRLVGPGDEPIDDADAELLASSPELLPGWYDDWLLVERERLTQLRVHALELLARRQLDGGRFADAVKAATAAMRLDPFRESTHRTLIAIHLAENNPVAALRQYRAYCRLLRAEFGDARPTARMLELIGPIVPPGELPG